MFKGCVAGYGSMLVGSVQGKLEGKHKSLVAVML